MNLQLLEDKIKENGISKSSLAGELGITRQSLFDKLSGIREFKFSQIKMLSRILNLTAKERELIFFADV